MGKARSTHVERGMHMGYMYVKEIRKETTRKTKTQVGVQY
jgi:hypothetical protein